MAGEPGVDTIDLFTTLPVEECARRLEHWIDNRLLRFYVWDRQPRPFYGTVDGTSVTLRRRTWRGHVSISELQGWLLWAHTFIALAVVDGRLVAVVGEGVSGSWRASVPTTGPPPTAPPGVEYTDSPRTFTR